MVIIMLILRIYIMYLVFTMLFVSSVGSSWSNQVTLEGVTVTPHVQSKEMRYRREADFSLGARVQLFVRNAGEKTLTLTPDTEIHLRGQTPEQLLSNEEWSWYDFPSAWPEQPLQLQPKALTVWTWNGRRAPWGVGTEAELSIQASGEEDASSIHIKVPIKQPEIWLSSVTFLGEDDDPYPERLIFHIANQTEKDMRLESCRLWLPKSNDSWRLLHAKAWLREFKAFPSNRIIPAGEKGGAEVASGRLPLTYTALEVRLRDANDQRVTLWAHLRIKREVFDISGGWVSSGVNGRSALTYESYLKTLKRMHINTAHIGEVAGYTDNPDLYSRYPLKRFNKLANFKRYDTVAMLPHIHAVEFLGEPQYGGGTPVPPMKVWRALAPYQPTRLPTTVTHSEERIWRFYAGLSDYPHYDAYRVCAPSADSWWRYRRWGDERIRWGAPLETIGVMTRSLRELNRPVPIAYWSQGAHHGWGNYGGRERTSPTPKELRAQAYHALAARITSLYWFNLSLKSILEFPDLIEPITNVGREIYMLEDYYLEGDAYHYERLMREDKPDWDLSVIAGPRGALLFALDLSYHADTDEKVFSFGPPRKALLSFPLPANLREAVQILRVDAEGVTSIPFETTSEGVQIQDSFKDVNVFVVTHDKRSVEKLETRRRELMAYEQSYGFDPAKNPKDIQQLQKILKP